jgi:hypothetical protein
MYVLTSALFVNVVHTWGGNNKKDPVSNVSITKMQKCLIQYL